MGSPGTGRAARVINPQKKGECLSKMTVSGNFSRIDHVDLTISLTEDKEPRTILVFAKNYNILRSTGRKRGRRRTAKSAGGACAPSEGCDKRRIEQPTFALPSPCSLREVVTLTRRSAHAAPTTVGSRAVREHCVLSARPRRGFGKRANRGKARRCPLRAA